MKNVFVALLMLSYAGLAAQSGFFSTNNNIEKWFIQGKEVEDQEFKKVSMMPDFQQVLLENQVGFEQVKTSFHFIDFDRNGQNDILFNGNIGSKAYVFIFNRHENHYLVAIGQRGSICASNLPEGEQLLNFSLWKESCCGDYVNQYVQYVCIANNNAAYFNTASQSLLLKGTFLPDKKIEKPVPFSIKAVGYLRIEPNVDTERRISGANSWRGNFVAMYPPKAGGMILAETKDKDGKFWYFVRMNNESGIAIHSDRFADTQEVEDAITYFYYGWITDEEVSFE